LARSVRDDTKREAGVVPSISCRGTVKALGHAQRLRVARFGITNVLLAVGASDDNAAAQRSRAEEKPRANVRPLLSLLTSRHGPAFWWTAAPPA
jgi:hypothetical protein